MAYIGLSPQYGVFEKQAITADGSTTTFTLNYTVGSSSSILVSVAGVHQEPEVAYNLGSGGTQIVFTAAPAAIDTVFIVFLGVAFEVATLGTGAITSQTALTTGVQGADTLLIYDDSAASLKKINLDDLIIGQTALTTGLQGADTLLIYDDSATEIKKVNLDDLIIGQTALTTGVQGADTLIIYDDSATEIKKINLDDLIIGQTELTSVANDDVLLIYDTSASEIKKIQKSNIAATLTYSSGTNTGDGSTTAFTISSGRSVDDTLVFVNGFQLTPTTDYTITGTTLTFITAPTSSAEITYRYLPVGGAYTSASFTGDGSSTTITIDAGRTVNDVLVIVNGLTLVPTDDYTIASTTLTFIAAPSSLAEITVRYLRLS